MRLWDPSQNGLLLEAPHRHNANGVFGGVITFPSWSLSTTSPLTSVDPFLRMMSSTSAMVGLLPAYRPYRRVTEAPRERVLPEIEPHHRARRLFVQVELLRFEGVDREDVAVRAARRWTRAAITRLAEVRDALNRASREVGCAPAPFRNVGC